MKNNFLHALEKAFSLKDKKLSNPKPPQELRDSFDLKLEEAPTVSDPKDLIEAIFSESVNTQNPRFLNQLYGGSTQEAWLGELLVSVLNTSMATYEIAPLFSLMEKEIFSALNQEVGFSQYEGLIVPGGSYANMLGLHCARYAYDSALKSKGLYKSSPLKVFVSEAAHYSSEKALGLLGMGTDALVKVKIDQNKKICLQDLKKKISEARAEGAVPLCVVSTAATTVWGSFDPIDEINQICKEENLWHHVDAAWGGLALWSEKKDTLLKGLSEVDSLTLDFHKLMASTLTKGVFLTSQPETLRKANLGGGAEYIFHKQGEDDNMDIGVYALQCGRKVNSLPVWLQWKLQGTEAFRNKVSELYSYSQEVVQFLQENADKYRLLQDPEYMNICFQVLPEKSNLSVGDFNKALRERLMARGKFMVNVSRTDSGEYFFRLVLSHWGLNAEVLKEFFVELDEIKAELDA